MSEPACSAPRTAAALGGTAPRHSSRTRPCPRHHRTATPGKDTRHVAVVARRAGVSRTFLYTNADAKTAVAEAIRESGDQRSRLLAEADDSREATWRERALNAEDALKAAHAEFLAQRTRIGELFGQIRDLEAEWTQDDVQRITAENTTLEQRVRRADRREPHTRRTTQSRPLQPALPRPSNCRP